MAVDSPPTDIASKLQQACALHQQGQLQAAESLYREILTAAPAHFDALRLLGMAAGQQGHAGVALELFSRALAVKPDDAATQANRGNALLALGRPDEALASYDRALELRPDFTEAAFKSGNLLQRLGRPAQALARYDRTLELQPDHLGALVNRGNALLELRRAAEALASYERALAIAPRNPAVLNSTCTALLALQRPAEALVRNDLALTLQPDDPGSLNNRGIALENLDRLTEALASFQQAVALRPDYADALNSQARVLGRLKRPAEALAAYAAVLRLRPDYPHALGHWLRLQMKLCDWNGLSAAFDQLAAGIAAGWPVASPFAVMATPLSLELQRQCAEILVRTTYPPASPAPAIGPGPKSAESRLRVGYFSADFRNHPVAYLTAGLFETHDRHKFTIIAFSFGPPAEDAMRARLEAAFDEFIDVRGKTDREIAQLAQAKGIDIAVDLMGMTSDSRTGIFAERAAPVQVSYLGYPGTMGAEYIDYLIADATVIPPEHRQHYREKIVCLPHTFQINDAKRSIAATAPDRAALGLPGQGFVFCNFNNSYKLTPDDFDIWMRLLQKVPGSVLWLAGTNPTAEANLRQEAKARGVAPERLVFKQFTALLEDHLAQIRHADLFLDSRYFNAHTTGSDALWAGVPLLTCPGETYASRVGASLLKAIGLPELIAPSLAGLRSPGARTGHRRPAARRHPPAARRPPPHPAPLRHRRLTRHLEAGLHHHGPATARRTQSGSLRCSRALSHDHRIAFLRVPALPGARGRATG